MALLLLEILNAYHATLCKHGSRRPGGHPTLILLGVDKRCRGCWNWELWWAFLRAITSWAWAGKFADRIMREMNRLFRVCHAVLCCWRLGCDAHAGHGSTSTATQV